MNLLAKRAGLVLGAAVLFLLSCEDDSFLLGFQGKKKFQGTYQEIVFDGEKSSVLLLDSVYTDQYELSSDPVPPAAYRYLLGQYNDPEFGTVRSEFFAQFYPNNSPISPPYFNTDDEVVTLDSVTVQLLFDYYVYGPEEDMDETITVYELTDSISYLKRYINNSTIPYSATPLRELSFKMDQLIYELANDAGRDSSFYLKGTLGSVKDDVNDPGWLFAKRLFQYVNSAGDSALVGGNIQEFRKQFFGLAFIPSTESKRMLGFNSLNPSSRLTMHYQTATKDSLSLSFYFLTYPYVGSNGFTNITTSRIGDLAGLPGPNIPYYPASPKRYIQDGSTVITELDLSDFYNFIDTMENIVINSAELSVDVVDSPPGMSPPSSLYGMIMKKTMDNKIVPLEMSVEEDSLKWRKYIGNTFTDLTSFVISNELSAGSPLMLSYDRNDNRYVGYATLFFQEMFNNKDKPELNIEHIGLYPSTAPLLKVIRSPLTGQIVSVPILRSGVGNQVNRAVLNASGIKLKLYYTKPILPNL